MRNKKHKRHVIISDTTLRDGEQTPGCRLNGDQKLQIARQLHRLGVDVIEAGFPASSPAEFQAVRQIARSVGRVTNAPGICSFGRCVPSDIQACWDSIKDAKHPRIHLFLASSDIHLKYKLKMSRSEALKRMVEGVRMAKSFIPLVQFSPEDSFRSDRGFLAQVVEAIIDAGVTTLNVTDTVGYATPAEFADLIVYLKTHVPNIHKATISVHCHNDLGMAVANSLAAVKVGADQVDGTINGIGERAGNCSLEEVIMSMKTRSDYFGVTTSVNARELYRTSQLVSSLTGMAVQANKAIVGGNAFSHASGIHQDGMLKHKRTYEIMDPADVGVSQTTLPLTARSGRSALAHRLRKMGVRLSPEKMAGFFDRFKGFADIHLVVEDRDLRRLIP